MRNRITEGPVLIPIDSQTGKSRLFEVDKFDVHVHIENIGFRGATVARLTPDEKAACSNHVGVNNFNPLLTKSIISNAFIHF